MNVVAVVQARVQSTRLPAKVLLDLGGKTALEQCIRRVESVRGVGEVVIATSDGGADDVIERVGQRLGFRVVRGSETDVLSRFELAARVSAADVVLRFTSDCPLLDPDESSTILERFLAERPDYASNTLDRRMPRGLDTEIMTRAALDRAFAEATATREREHVTVHLYENPSRYRLLSVVSERPEDLSALRWTLDTLDDYRFLHAVFELLGPNATAARTNDVMAVLRGNPHLLEINTHVAQKKA